MRFCEWCKKQLTKAQKRFCSVKCYGLSMRGTGTSHIRIRVGGKRVYLHRWKVEQRIRPLKDGEIVHHENENKFDNSLSNLKILDGAAAHLQKHNYWRDRRAAKQAAEDFTDFGW